MKTNVTAGSVKKMKYADLVQLAKKKGIEFKNQSRQKLIDLILTKLGSLENEIPEAEEVETPNGKEQSAVKAPKLKEKAKPAPKAVDKKEKVKKTAKKEGETKSSKILAMYLKGKKVSEISKALNAHPSFCYTVIGKHKANKAK